MSEFILTGSGEGGKVNHASQKASAMQVQWIMSLLLAIQTESFFISYEDEVVLNPVQRWLCHVYFACAIAAISPCLLLCGAMLLMLVFLFSHPATYLTLVLVVNHL